jgi:hypothetical protein
MGDIALNSTVDAVKFPDGQDPQDTDLISLRS